MKWNAHSVKMKREAKLHIGIHRKPKSGATYNHLEWASPYVLLPQEQQNSTKSHEKNICYHETKGKKTWNEKMIEKREGNRKGRELGNGDGMTNAPAT
ncbi:hypothetical protein E2542_SST26607 [Spatholobus suberectus]|nr:hypothetical protein E2542_SST26607 [Spatholobus suberectus]